MLWIRYADGKTRPWTAAVTFEYAFIVYMHQLTKAARNFVHVSAFIVKDWTNSALLCEKKVNKNKVFRFENT